MTRTVQNKELRKWKPTPGIEINIFVGHLIVSIAKYEWAVAGEKLKGLRDACNEALGEKE